MKAYSLVLIGLVAASGGRAFAQSGDQAPPPAYDPSAQYRPSDNDYDPADEVQATDDGTITTDAPAVDEATFNASLSPYGAWVTVSGLGRVWRPYPTIVGPDFLPYASSGHWVYTNVGWTWVSEWEWGWAPFHYGRWWYDDYYGWVWTPGYVWGPAWVSWRWGGGYIGWAPLAPYGFHYHRHHWGRSWCFVDEGHFTSERVYWHREPATRVEVHHERTSPGATRGGPPVGNIAHATGAEVRVRPLPESGALPVQNAMRPRPVNPGGGGAQPLRVPASESNVARPESFHRPEQSARPQNVEPVRPTFTPPAQERSHFAPPAAHPVERMTPPSRPSPSAIPARPQSTISRPAAPAARPVAPARPAPAKKK